MMIRRCLTLLVLSSLAAAQIAAPPEVLRAFGLRAATVQEFALPPRLATAQSLAVVLGGATQMLDLAPHDPRSPGFRALVDDGKQVLEIPAAPAMTCRGSIQGLADSQVAGSIEAGRLSALIRIGGKQTFGIEPVAKLLPGLPPAWHVVFRAEDELFGDARCGLQHAGPLAGGSVGGPGPAALKIAEIAIDADEDYYVRNGSNTTNVQNAVNSVLNAVDVIYRRDCEIGYTLTALIIRTSATYSGTDMNSLLTQFGSRWNSSHTGVKRDLAHMFTGKGSFSGVVGIAYLGVVCSVGSAYGVSKVYASSLTTNAGLVAHETGHNWNAPHCDATPPCNIMCSGLGGCAGILTSFGAVSSATIVGFKNSLSCLDDPPPPFAPVLTSLTPGTVTSHLPAEVTVTGTYLDTVQKVEVGGLLAASMTKVSPTTLRFRPASPAPIGAAQVVATNGKGPSNGLPLQTAGNHPSALEVPIFALRGYALPYKVHSDKAWNALLLLSLSNQPSSLQNVVSLGIGNAFTDLTVVVTMAADTTGTAITQLNIPTTVPASVVLYWQAVTYDPGNLTLPLEVSDVKSNATY